MMDLRQVRLKPEDRTFNWVKARDRCSIALVFGLLTKAVRQATEDRNSLSEEPAAGFEFIADQNGENTYAVVLRKSDGVKVEFRREGRYTHIEGYGIEEMRLRAGISQSMDCVPIVDSTPLPYWYIASQVLDALFFDDGSDRPR